MTKKRKYTKSTIQERIDRLTARLDRLYKATDVRAAFVVRLETKIAGLMAELPQGETVTVNTLSGVPANTLVTPEEPKIG